MPQHTPRGSVSLEVGVKRKDGKTDQFLVAWQAFDAELNEVVLEVEHLLAGALQ